MLWHIMHTSCMILLNKVNNGHQSLLLEQKIKLPLKDGEEHYRAQYIWNLTDIDVVIEAGGSYPETHKKNIDTYKISIFQSRSILL